MIEIYQQIFAVTKKTAQWRINLKSFENLNYLKFIEHKFLSLIQTFNYFLDTFP